MKASLLAFLLPCLAVANIPSVRIVLPEYIAPPNAGIRLEPEIELTNSGQVALQYRVYPDGNRAVGHPPIWAGRISFELVDDTGKEIAPIYIPLHDYFCARKAILGTEAPVRLRYAWPLSTKLGPGRYTLGGTTVVEDEHGKRHKIHCTPAAFVVTAESGTTQPATPIGIGNH